MSFISTTVRINMMIGKWMGVVAIACAVPSYAWSHEQDNRLPGAGHEHRLACTASSVKDFEGTSTDTLRVLATLDADTVFLVQGSRPPPGWPGDTRLLWTSGFGVDREEWRSSSFGGIIPRVSLVHLDIDESSKPVLFYTVHYENFIFGSVYGRRPASARELFRSREACRVPKLRDVTGDGRLNVLHYAAGAFSVEECKNEALAWLCMRQYPTEWIEVWSLDKDSVFVRDSLGASAYYRKLAEEYRSAAAELAAALDRGPDAVPSQLCDMSMVRALRNMADRAARIGGIP